MDGKNRMDIKPGIQVKVVQKQDQSSGKLTEGTVEKLLTNSPNHPHGIKVRLVGGIVGRVKEILSVLLAVIMVTQLLVGCGTPMASSTATTPEVTSPTGATNPSATTALDEHVVGFWTNEAKRVKVIIIEKGEPAGSVPVGEWYVFERSGRFYRIARFITVAIGGVMVEEGQFTTENGAIHLYNRTESFFPDQGSPQKAKYREPLSGDASLWYRFTSDNAVDGLYMKTDPGQAEILFRRCIN